MLVMVIDRQWKTAAIWALVGAIFAVCGIIHVPEAGFENFSEPTWEQCDIEGYCWPFAEQWMFFVSYLMLFGTFGLIEVSRKFQCDPALLPPLEDETTHAFHNWFEDAAVDTHMHTRDPADQVDEARLDKSTMFKPDHFVTVDDPDITASTRKVSFSADGEKTSVSEEEPVYIPGDNEEFGA